MLLQLKKIPFYVINLESSRLKRDRIEKQLNQLGLDFHFVKAVKTKPKCIGVALSHLKVLTQHQSATPFGILEDDCVVFFDRFQEQLTLPDHTAGLYLGTSMFGVRPKDKYGLCWGEEMTTKYSIFNDDFLRIHAMLARHALIYLSDEIKKDAIVANKKALYHFDFPYPGDMAYVPLQKKYLMLAPKKPWFYQNEDDQGSHRVTKDSLLNKIKPLNEAVERKK